MYIHDFQNIVWFALNFRFGIGYFASIFFRFQIEPICCSFCKKQTAVFLSENQMLIHNKGCLLHPEKQIFDITSNFDDASRFFAWFPFLSKSPDKMWNICRLQKAMVLLTVPRGRLVICGTKY